MPFQNKGTYNSGYFGDLDKKIKENQKTAYQQNVAQPVQTAETPTTRSTLGKLMQIANKDPEMGYKLQQDFEYLQSDPTSMYFYPYTKPTNPAVSNLQSLGVDVSNINDNWYDTNSYYAQFFKTSNTTGKPVSPGSKASLEQNIAYNYHLVQEQRDTTAKAKMEAQALDDFVSYWANRADRNLSDDDIISKINWNDYPTQQKMLQATAEHYAIPLNEAVDMATDDWLRGKIWAARNGGGTGSIWQDMARSYNGDGNVWKENKDITARLSFGTDTYAPYTVGSTLDDVCTYYGVDKIDREYLNTHLPDQKNKTDMDMWSKADTAVSFTENAQKEAAEANAWLDDKLSSATEADAQNILKQFERKLGSKWKYLKQMDDSTKKPGNLIGTTYAIDYSYNDAKRKIAEACGANSQKLTANQTVGKYGVTTQTDQSAEIEQAEKSNVTSARVELDDQMNQSEKNVFSNTPSTLWGFLWNTLSQIDPIKLIKQNEPEQISKYATSITELGAQVAENQSAQAELDRMYKTNNAIVEKLSEVREAWLSGDFDAVPDYVKKIWEGENTWNNMALLYKDVTGSDVSEKEDPHRLAGAFYDYIVGTTDSLTENGENPWLLSGLVDRKQELEATIDRTKNAQADYDKQQEAWDKKISLYDRLGLDTTGLRTAQKVSSVLSEFSNYEDPSEWNSKGTYEQIADDALKNNENVWARIDAEHETAKEDLESARWLKEYISENNITISDNIQKKFYSYLAKLERDEADYEYINIRRQKDYIDQAREGKIKEIQEKEQPPISVDMIRAGVPVRWMDNPLKYGLECAMIGVGFDMIPADELMTQDEKETYYYLYETKGFDAASEYYDHLAGTYGVLNTRHRERIEDEAKEEVNGGFFSGAWANLKAMGSAPLDAIGGLTYFLQRAITGEEFSPDDPLLASGHRSQAVNSETIRNIQESKIIPDGIAKEAVQGLYEIIYNRGRSAANMVFGGPAIGGKFGELLTEIVGSVPMAIGAGALAVADAKEKKIDDDKAYLIGLATIGLESLTEGVTRGNIKKAFGGGEKALRSIGDYVKEWLTNSGLDEALGETATDYFEGIIDEALAGGYSDHEQRVADWIKELKLDPSDPLARERAEELARQDEIGGLLHTAIISYLSPGTETVTAIAKNGLSDYHNIRVKTRQLQQSGLNVSMLDVRKEYQQWKERARYEAENAAREERVDAAQPNAPQTETAQQESSQADVAKQEAQAANLTAGYAVGQEQTPAQQKQAPTPSEADMAFMNELNLLESVQTSDSSTQADAIGTVLGGEENTAAGDESHAAAANMTNLFRTMGDSVTQIWSLMYGAHDMGMDEAVKTAIRMAALSEQSASAQVIKSEAFRTAPSIEAQVNMLVQAATQDRQNQAVMQDMQKNVREYRIAAKMAELIKQNPLTATPAAQEAADKASETMQQAETALTEAQSVKQAKEDASNAARTEAINNPTKENTDANTKALNELEGATVAETQAEAHLEKTQQANEAAQAKAEEAKQQELNSRRQEAEQLVAQEDQKRAEEKQKIDEEKEYEQALIDNGITAPEVEADPDNLFATDEEMEARKRAHFIYNNGTIQYAGELNEGMEQALTDAGFHKETETNPDTGKTNEYYVANRNDVSVETLKQINDSINAQQDERSGKAWEDNRDSIIEDILNKEHLEGTARDERRQQLQDMAENIKLNKIDMTGLMNNTEGYLAVSALGRKLGIGVQLSDTLPGNARGMYKDGVVYLNNNLIKNGKMTIGQALVEATLHEITHSMESTKNYKTYRNVVLEALYGKDWQNSAEYRAAIDQKQVDYKNSVNQDLTPDEAEREIIADFARTRLNNKDVVNRLMDAGLGGRMRNALHNINQAIKNFRLTGEEKKTAEYLRRAERAFQRAMDEVARTETHPEGGQFSVAQIAQSTGMTFNPETLKLYDQNGNEVYGVTNVVTPEMITSSPVGMLIDSGLTGEQNQKAKEMMAGLMNMVAKYKDSNLIWEIGATTLSSTFSALKSNSDPQYKTTVDFGTVCAKTQAIVDVMSKVMTDKIDPKTGMLKEGAQRGLTREDVMKVYDAVNKAGLSVPCPVCYVFSRWMGVPSLLGQMSQYQADYVVTNEDGSINKEETQKVASRYIKEAEAKYGDAKTINNAKTKMQNSLAKLENTRMDLEAQLKDKSLTDKQRKSIEAKIKETLGQMTELDKQIGEVSAYNWITQALCKKDKSGNYVVDDKFRLTPDAVLFDLNRTGEFAEYEKNWKYRNTRGAGMGKAIMPYSGETIGDILYGVKNGGRQNTIKNPWLNMDSKAAARQLRYAQERAAKQNLVGGQRLQSTSDFRPEWGLDYIMSFLELQAAGSKVQMYTKVAEAVDFFASVGADVNMSIMGKGQGWHVDEDGNYVLDFSNITGMDFDTAKALKDKYNNVQMILVGMNDTHIRLAMANSDIDFIIPWHSSGNSKDVLAKLISSVGEKLDSSVDYSTTQADSVAENRTEEQKALWDARVKLLMKGGNALTQEERKTLLSNPYTADLYNRFTKEGVDPDCYGIKLNKDQANQIFPYEYWDTSLTKDQADENGRRFVEYCESMGIVPRFSQFKDDTGYWKLLIDRPMYNNDGTYHQQQVIDVTNARIGELDEEGRLTGSDLPMQAQAKYAPKDPRSDNYAQYTEAEKKAVDTAKAALDVQYEDGTAGQYSVYGNEVTAADMEQMLAQEDADYMSAVERGDMEEAQMMVDEKAEEAGYSVKAYHGTPTGGFTVFDTTRRNYGRAFGDGIYFTDSRNAAENFSVPSGRTTGEINRMVYESYLNLGDNPYVIDVDQIRDANKKKPSLIKYLVDEAVKNAPDDATSIVLQGVYDGSDEKSTVYVVKNSNQVKSADTVTYDDQGNVISLSERFNPNNADIRYSSEGETTLADLEQALGIEYMKPFAEQVDDFMNPDIDNNKVFKRDSLLVGEAPEAFVQIGLPKLPVTINQQHVKKALTGEGVDEKYKPSHTFAPDEFKKLPEKIAAPIAIGYDPQSTKQLIVYVDMQSNSGEQVIVPLRIGGITNIGNQKINALKLDTTMSRVGNAGKSMLESAIRNDSQRKATLFYIDKEKAAASRLGDDILNIVRGLDSGAIHTVSDPSSLVKIDVPDQESSLQFKRWFKGSKVVNEDGTPMVVYHGTSESFTAFDMSKGRSTMDIQGAFFSPWEEDSAGYGDNVGAFYLSIKNPASEKEAYAALNMFKGQNEAGKKAREYLISKGYDGVINGVAGQPEEFIAFYPEQIKSATDNIGTFDRNNPDYLYSTGGKNTTADDEQLLVNSGIITQEELDAFNGNLPGQPTTEGGSAQRQFGSHTAQTSDALHDDVKEYLYNHSGYTPDTNQAQIDRSIDWVRSHANESDPDGFFGAMQEAQNGDFDSISADGQARMLTLMSMAALKGEATGDHSAELMLADMFNKQGTEAGRALQARKIFRLMTPVGRIATLNRMADQINEEYGKKGLSTRVALSDLTLLAAAAAETEDDFQKVREAARKELAEQMPANWKEKLQAWRMLAMLGNPRTHIRNLVGNAIFMPAVGLKNKIGAGLEAAFVKNGDRTKTLGLASQDARAFAKEDAQAMESVLRGESKYNEGNAVQQERKMFGQGNGIISKTLGRGVQAVSDLSGNALELEDWVFLKRHYQNALAGYMTANKLTAEDMTGDTLDKARAYAVNEAQKATYRDANEIASWLNNLKNPVGRFLVNAILPFKKTPANILKRGIEYSPVSLIRSLTTDAKHLKQWQAYQNGELSVLPDKAISPNQFIDRLASGLSGTAIAALGALLSHLGVVKVNLGDDDDEFDKLQGSQEYSIELFGNSYTIDWAAPVCMPFFVGATIMEELEKKDGGEGLDVGKTLESILNIAEPVFNLSMLDGVNSTLTTSQYGEGNNITQIGEKILTNYATSFIPTLSGQVARSIDTTRRKSYVESGADLSVFRSALEQVENKIPFLSRTNIPYRDVWGNADTSSQGWAIIENFLSPGYGNELKNDPVTNELKRLYEETGDKNLIPKTASKTISVGGETVKLNAEQYDQYVVDRGHLAYESIKSLMKSPVWQVCDDDTRAMMISDAWTYANQISRHNLDSKGKKDAWVANAEYNNNFVDTAIDRAAEANRSDYIKGYGQTMAEAIDTGDTEMYELSLAALDSADAKESEIRSSLRDYFKPKYQQAFEEGDEDTMEEIEWKLLDVDVGFKEKDFSTWVPSEDEEEDEEQGNRNRWLNRR